MTSNAEQSPMDPVLRLLRVRTGLVFPPSRRKSAEQAIATLVASTGLTSAWEYASTLEDGRTPLQPLVDAVTIGETYFFREPAHYDFIRREVLPSLRRGGANEAKNIRMWSAGCASGEEAYSLAILLEEEGLPGQARVLATDISARALAAARRGVFGRWSLRGCDDDFVARYFRREGARFSLVERIRRAVTFETLNLALDVYPSVANGTAATDFIFCRNVLIYFDRDTVRDVARGLFESLSEGGWLITGPSDPPLSGHAPFETVMTPGGVYYRRTTASARLKTAAPELVSSAPATPQPTPQPAYPRAWASKPVAADPPSPLEVARAAFASGDFAAVVQATGASATDPAAAALYLRAFANTATPEHAVEAALGTLQQHPMAAEIHFITATLLVGIGHDEEAAGILRKAIYLDRSAAIAHFLLASVLQRQGDVAGAVRSYRNTLRAVASRPPGEPVPFADGETYGRLAEATANHLRLLHDANDAAERTA